MKEKKAGLITVCVIIAVAVFGAAGILAGSADEEQVSVGEVKEMILASMEEINTYKFDINQTTKMVMSNETGEVETRMISNGSGIVDSTNKKMVVDTSMKMTSEEMPARKPIKTEMEMYFVNNTAYIKRDLCILEIPVLWVKEERLSEDYWESQNKIEQLRELLNVSEMELLADEEVEGMDSYLLNMSEFEKSWDTVKRLLGIKLPMQKEMINSLSIKISIAKDTKLPLKSEMKIEMVMSSEDLNISEMEERFTQTIDHKMETVFYGYNEPVTIELPLEAESALETPIAVKHPLECDWLWVEECTRGYLDGNCYADCFRICLIPPMPPGCGLGCLGACWVPRHCIGHWEYVCV